MPFSGDYSGYELDTSFIEESHHTNPRRLYSTYGADWQYRVDHERMRRERLDRARAEMIADDMGAIVVFAGANVRYLTGSYQGNWKYNINIIHVCFINFYICISCLYVMSFQKYT